ARAARVLPELVAGTCPGPRLRVQPGADRDGPVDRDRRRRRPVDRRADRAVALGPAPRSARIRVTAFRAPAPPAQSDPGGRFRKGAKPPAEATRPRARPPRRAR